MTRYAQTMYTPDPTARSEIHDLSTVATFRLEHTVAAMMHGSQAKSGNMTGQTAQPTLHAHSAAIKN